MGALAASSGQDKFSGNTGSGDCHPLTPSWLPASTLLDVFGVDDVRDGMKDGVRGLASPNPIAGATQHVAGKFGGQHVGGCFWLDGVRDGMKDGIRGLASPDPLVGATQHVPSCNCEALAFWNEVPKIKTGFVTSDVAWDFTW